MHTREWRWYLNTPWLSELIEFDPWRKEKSLWQGKNVTVEIQYQAATVEAALNNCYIFFSVHTTCRVSPETLISLEGGVSCSSDWTDTPALCDQTCIQPQELHLRHTDPEKPEMTVPGKGVWSLHQAAFNLPCLYLPYSSSHHTGKNVKGENPWSLQKKN